MKKLFLPVAILIMILFVSTGCQSKAGKTNANPTLATSSSSPQSASPATTPTDNASSSSDNTIATTDSTTQGWPTSKLYNVPEWKGITKYFGGGGSLDDYVDKSYLFTVEATANSMKQYLDTLKTASYTIEELKNPSGYSADLGPVSIKITHSTKSGANNYEIDINLKKISSWPSADMPSFITQLKDKTLVGDVSYFEPGDEGDENHTYLADTNGYNLGFTYSGFTKDEGIAYMKDLASKLKDGKYGVGGIADAFGNIKGTFDWNGKTYNVSGEITQMDDKTYDFVFAWSTGEVD